MIIIIITFNDNKTITIIINYMYIAHFHDTTCSMRFTK